MITIEAIHKKLVQAIKQSGLTQTEIAKQLNLTQSSIAHYIKGDICPSIETLANLCKVIGVPPNEILCYEE